MERRKLAGVLAILGLALLISVPPLIYFNQVLGGCSSYISLYGPCSAANPPLPGAVIVAVLVAGLLLAAAGIRMRRRTTAPGPP